MITKPYLIFVLFFFWNCASNSFYNNLKNGDLIFVEAGKENLSGAISRVTKNDSISFDHVALVEVENKNKFILHSYPNAGSEKIKAKTFIRNFHKKNRTLVAYRLNSEYTYCIKNALEKANAMLGKPYNVLYILNDEAYYCSDFIERAYKTCNIFSLEPMTFKNPKNGEIDEYWKTFYKNKNIEVPEGKLGSNPNGISKSKKLHKTATLK